MNTLIVRVEKGDLYCESYSGNWLTDFNCLTSIFDAEIVLLLRTEPDVEIAIKLSAQTSKRVFEIVINDPHWVCDPGYWDMSYGYVNAESHLEWSDILVTEVTK